MQALVAALVEAVEGAAPVSVKMRSGFDDTSLFEDALLAAQAGGAAFVTLHPRTKRQAYAGGADWSLVARAKALLDIPVVGCYLERASWALGRVVQEVPCACPWRSVSDLVFDTIIGARTALGLCKSTRADRAAPPRHALSP
jgi:hypothetical protein